MTRRKRIKKTKKEIDIENQIKILEQQLAIERSKSQNQSKDKNQSIIKKPAREILKNDYRDVNISRNTRDNRIRRTYI